MKIITKYLGSALVASALLVPAGIAAPAARQADHPQRYYDQDRKDYHEWNDREQHAYREWTKEHHRKYRDYSKISQKQQREYWRWRHEHPQAYR
jgi:hypothetical protein